MLRTWEFDPSNPIRSMASIRMSNLLLILVIRAYRLFGKGENPHCSFERALDQEDEFNRTED